MAGTSGLGGRQTIRFVPTASELFLYPLFLASEGTTIEGSACTSLCIPFSLRYSCPECPDEPQLR